MSITVHFPVGEKNSTREGFGRALADATKENPDIIALSADLEESTRLNYFKEVAPERFVEVGVAEQNLASVVAGFAMAGKLPVAASYAAFLCYNAYGGIRTAICYSNLNVKLMGGHAGLGIGPDGATHQALEDIALMRTLPNMTVLVPSDAQESYQATHATLQHNGPCYLRTTKYATTTYTTPDDTFEIGAAKIMTQGSDVMLITCGPMVEQAVLAHQVLSKQGIQAQVVNMHTIKPLDTTVLVNAAKNNMPIITIEDHQITGGLGSAVLESLAKLGIQLPIKLLAVEDKFGESGTPNELYKKHGLTSHHIVQVAEKMLR
ncbi:MAG: transketolase family protein [Pseudomonadales bacterium]|nr:transketolase family protein [Candidatus Woesebacteria bacterium]MCB9802085.1 transketolase family protein [Pseudomonadales bacterium]